MTYRINNFFAHFERDDWQNGCIDDPANGCKTYDVTLEAETKEALVTKVMEEFDVKYDDIELNACDESGRIDIQRLENVDADKPNAGQLSHWKQGHDIKIFHVVYTGQLEKVHNKLAW